MLLRIRVARVRESPLRLITAVEAGQIFLDFATDTPQFIEMHSDALKSVFGSPEQNETIGRFCHLLIEVG